MTKETKQIFMNDTSLTCEGQAGTPTHDKKKKSCVVEKEHADNVTNAT